MEENPNYYAVISAEVRYDKDLRANEKLLYGEITALAHKTGECWASNKYFSELYNVKPNAVATWIKDLKDKKYIEVDYEYKGKEIIKRIIKIGGIQKDNTYSQKDSRGGIQKGEENNTSINNTSKENIKRYFEDSELNDLFIEFLQIRRKVKAVNSDRVINYLLNKLNKYDDDMKKSLIERSIVNSWKDIYPYKENYSTQQPKAELKEIEEGYFKLI